MGDIYLRDTLEVIERENRLGFGRQLMQCTDKSLETLLSQ